MRTHIQSFQWKKKKKQIWRIRYVKYYRWVGKYNPRWLKRSKSKQICVKVLYHTGIEISSTESEFQDLLFQINDIGGISIET